MQDTLTDLLRHSALVLAQEFLYTDFDWRIGVLNGRAIYACRYYMARNHWQIYNHDLRSVTLNTPRENDPSGVLSIRG